MTDNMYVIEHLEEKLDKKEFWLYLKNIKKYYVLGKTQKYRGKIYNLVEFSEDYTETWWEEVR